MNLDSVLQYEETAAAFVLAEYPKESFQIHLIDSYLFESGLHSKVFKFDFDLLETRNEFRIYSDLGGVHFNLKNETFTVYFYGEKKVKLKTCLISIACLKKITLLLGDRLLKIKDNMNLSNLNIYKISPAFSSFVTDTCVQYLF